MASKLVYLNWFCTYNKTCFSHFFICNISVIYSTSFISFKLKCFSSTKIEDFSILKIRTLLSNFRFDRPIYVEKNFKIIYYIVNTNVCSTLNKVLLGDMWLLKYFKRKKCHLEIKKHKFWIHNVRVIKKIL